MIRICKLEEVDIIGRIILPIWLVEGNALEFGIVPDIKEWVKEFRMMVESPQAEVFLLFKEDKIVGVLGMAIFKNPIGKERIANEHFWYVLPSYRGLGSIKLIKEANKWAKEKGCSHIMFNASKMASDLHDKVCGLYERLGMKHFETVYIQDIREV